MRCRRSGRTPLRRAPGDERGERTQRPQRRGRRVPGAADALIQGVIAAKSEARRRGFSQVAIGFNWAYASGPAETAFWRRLGRSGGALFRSRSTGSDSTSIRDVGPAHSGQRSQDDGQDDARVPGCSPPSIHAARRSPSSVPIHVSETGYPTGLVARRRCRSISCGSPSRS